MLGSVLVDLPTRLGFHLESGLGTEGGSKNYPATPFTPQEQGRRNEARRRTSPERTPVAGPSDDFVSMFGKLELKENQSAERELQEKLGRFYVETGPFIADRSTVLKAGGFRWEPIVKHWWAPEMTLRHKAIFIGRWQVESTLIKTRWPE